jgi:hypothetical protein
LLNRCNFSFLLSPSRIWNWTGKVGGDGIEWTNVHSLMRKKRFSEQRYWQTEEWTWKKYTRTHSAKAEKRFERQRSNKIVLRQIAKLSRSWEPRKGNENCMLTKMDNLTLSTATNTCLPTNMISLRTFHSLINKTSFGYIVWQ